MVEKCKMLPCHARKQSQTVSKLHQTAPGLRARLWAAKSFREEILTTLMKFEHFAETLGSDKFFCKA